MSEVSSLRHSQEHGRLELPLSGYLSESEEELFECESSANRSPSLLSRDYIIEQVPHCETLEAFGLKIDSETDNPLELGQALLNKASSWGDQIMCIRHVKGSLMLTALKTMGVGFCALFAGHFMAKSENANRTLIKNPPKILTAGIRYLASVNRQFLKEGQEGLDLKVFVVSMDKRKMKGDDDAVFQDLNRLFFNKYGKMLTHEEMMTEVREEIKNWEKAIDSLTGVEDCNYDMHTQLVALATDLLFQDLTDSEDKDYAIDQITSKWISTESSLEQPVVVVKYAAALAEKFNPLEKYEAEALKTQVNSQAQIFAAALVTNGKDFTYEADKIEQQIWDALKQNPTFKEKMEIGRTTLIEQVAKVRNFERETQKVAVEIQDKLSALVRIDIDKQTGEELFFENTRILATLNPEIAQSIISLEGKKADLNLLQSDAPTYEQKKQELEDLEKATRASFTEEFKKKNPDAFGALRTSLTQSKGSIVTDEEVGDTMFNRWIQYLVSTHKVYQEAIGYLRSETTPGELVAQYYNYEEREQKAREKIQQLKNLQAMMQNGTPSNAEDFDITVAPEVTKANIENRYNLPDNAYKNMFKTLIGMSNKGEVSATLAHEFIQFLTPEKIASLFAKEEEEAKQQMVELLDDLTTPRLVKGEEVQFTVQGLDAPVTFMQFSHEKLGTLKQLIKSCEQWQAQADLERHSSAAIALELLDEKDQPSEIPLLVPQQDINSAQSNINNFQPFDPDEDEVLDFE